MKRVILASTSPRRKELLTQMGVPFTVLARSVDESADKNVDPTELARSLAEAKVSAVRDNFQNAPSWILGADTLVFDEEGWLGKPESAEKARAYLRRLAGKSHSVVTAVSLLTAADKIETRHETTTVTFAELGDGELEWYVDTNEWQGVAGGYRIQGRAACFVTEIRGAYSTVVGLPLRTVYSMFVDNNYPFTSR